MMIMRIVRRVAPKTMIEFATRGLHQGLILPRPPLPWTISYGYGYESLVPAVNSRRKRQYSGKSWKGYDGEEKEEDNDDEWNDAWESAWIPDESSSGKAPWEREDSSCSSFPPPWPTPAHTPDEEEERRNATQSVHNINSKREQMTTLMKRITQVVEEEEEEAEELQSKTPTFRPHSPEEDERQMHQNQQQLLYNENHPEEYKISKKTVAKEEDYRIAKHRVHAALWLKEIQKQQEEANASLGGNPANDDIEQLLDKCSQFFDYAEHDPRLPDDPNFKIMPEGWEAVAKDKDGRPWEISQKEEDILLQEFERRMAFNKIQIASFVKSHIFSRRRPIDGWKYMIEELGPNSKKGRGLSNKFAASADGPRRSFDDNEKGIVRREFVKNRQ